MPYLSQASRSSRTTSPFPSFQGEAATECPGCLGRPQAESIMMLGCQDGHLETSFLERTYPLLRIEIGGIEECGIFFAVSPIHVL